MRLCTAVALLVTLAAAPSLAADEPMPATPDTFPRVVTLAPIEVSTTRFTTSSPVARTTLTRDEVRARNWGQDTPMALATLPGAYAYSDAGNGVGYSYLSIRGFPQRRISVLVNGVPLNDPESHEVYWIDHPDLLASTAELTVQRGVGAALYGAAAVGGSVNITTSPFTHAPEQRVTVGYGSFETKRVSVETNSGDLAGGWNLYGRYSRVESFGYREQSWSKLWSYTIAARRVLGRHSLQANLYGGPEETHLAYYGLSPEALAQNRRFNPLTYPNERDHFFEPHYELIHHWVPGERLALSQTLFWFDGKGFYDERRLGESLAGYRLASWLTADSTLADRTYYAQNPDGSLTQDGSGRFTLLASDLVRRRTVVNRHYGWVPRASWQHAKGTLTVGGELRGHDGRHFGEVKFGSTLPPGTAPDHAYYDYHPQTLSAGLYAREEWTPAPAWIVTADAAWRHQSYSMRRDRFDGLRFEQKYDFFNPRLGVAWRPASAFNAFASWAQTRREPSFRNLYDAEGVGNVPRFARLDPATGEYVDPLIRPERVQDWELGASWSRGWGGRLRLTDSPAGATGPREGTVPIYAGGSLALSANAFRMDFRDELVDAGQFDTDLGYARVANAARSIHQGLELAGSVEHQIGLLARLRLEANVTLSDNHFVDYVEFDDLGGASRFDGNAIGLFPATMSHVALRAEAGAAWLGIATESAGRIHLDNSESDERSLDPRTVLHLSAGTRMRVAGAMVDLSLRVLNAGNHLYSAGGYGYTWGGARYAEVIPAATRAVMGEVGVRF